LNSPRSAEWFSVTFSDSWASLEKLCQSISVMQYEVTEFTKYILFIIHRSLPCSILWSTLSEPSSCSKTSKGLPRQPRRSLRRRWRRRCPFSLTLPSTSSEFYRKSPLESKHFVDEKVGNWEFSYKSEPSVES